MKSRFLWQLFSCTFRIWVQRNKRWQLISRKRKKKGWMGANVSKENSWVHKKHLSCKINFISRLTSWCSSPSRKTNSSWISGRWMTTSLSGSKKTAKKKKKKFSKATELNFSRAAMLGRKKRKALQEKFREELADKEKELGEYSERT